MITLSPERPLITGLITPPPAEIISTQGLDVAKNLDGLADLSSFDTSIDAIFTGQPE